MRERHGKNICRRTTGIVAIWNSKTNTRTNNSQRAVRRHAEERQNHKKVLNIFLLHGNTRAPRQTTSLLRRTCLLSISAGITWEPDTLRGRNVKYCAVYEAESMCWNSLLPMGRPNRNRKRWRGWILCKIRFVPCWTRTKKEKKRKRWDYGDGKTSGSRNIDSWGFGSTDSGYVASGERLEKKWALRWLALLLFQIRIS